MDSSQFFLRETQERLTNWWNCGKQDRPCILGFADKRATPCVEPDQFWTQPDVMCEIVAERQRNTAFFGEALPYLYIDYGAPAMAIQMGAKPKWTSTETIWTDPGYETIEEVTNVKPHGKWKEIQRAAIEKGLELCNGKAMLASYCLGTCTDTIASLVGSENLLYALLDEPDMVKRAFRTIADITLAEFKRLWKRCIETGNTLTGWHGIWSPEATTPIQDDFSYMISTEMYNEFCLPFVYEQTEEIPYSLYHLDGVGALRHLPTVCKVPKLKAIQWVPGDGKDRILDWIDVIRTILDSGKSCQVYVKPEEVEPLINEVGSDRMLLVVKGNMDEMCRLAERYDLPERSFE